jgi:transposase
LRYPSDLTDDEWKLVEPLIPPGKPGGGKRTVIMREVVNGLMYLLSTGCQWRAIPKDLPPKSPEVSGQTLRHDRSTCSLIRFAPQCRTLHQSRVPYAVLSWNPETPIIREMAIFSEEMLG